MVNIYVLELENNKFYIGKTKNLEIRIDTHFKLGGSCWTSIHKPKKVLEIIKNCDDYDEDKYTLKYMKKYGIENVRGGSFCKIKLDSEQNKVLNDMINSITNKCYICNESNHFAKDCKKIKILNFLNELFPNNESVERKIIKIETIINNIIKLNCDIDILSYIENIKSYIVEISNINSKILNNKNDTGKQNELNSIQIKNKTIFQYLNEINHLYVKFFPTDKTDNLYIYKNLEIKCLKMLDLYFSMKIKLDKTIKKYNNLDFLNDILKKLYNDKLLSYNHILKNLN